jgi:hypothetical protein
MTKEQTVDYKIMKLVANIYIRPLAKVGHD